MANTAEELPLVLTVADKWQIPNEQLIGLDQGQVLLSDRQEIFTNALYMKLGILAKQPSEPNGEMNPNDKMYVFCQFDTKIEHFTVLIYMKLLNMNCNTVMYRFDVMEERQRTPMYPIIKIVDWVNSIQSGTATEIAYEISIFMAIPASMKQYSVGRRHQYYVPPYRNWDQVMLVTDSKNEELLLDQNLLLNSFEGKGNFKIFTDDEARYFKIVLKYIYYKMVPPLHEITAGLLAFALHHKLPQFVQLCQQVERNVHMKNCTGVFRGICEQYLRIDGEITTPTEDDFYKFLTLSSTVPPQQMSTTFIYGLGPDSGHFAFHPYCDYKEKPSEMKWKAIRYSRKSPEKNVVNKPPDKGFFQMIIIIADKWVLPTANITESRYKPTIQYPLLSKLRPLIQDTLDLEIGLIVMDVAQPEKTADSEEDYLYVFCQFKTLEIPNLTVYANIISTFNQKNIKFRCDIRKGYQRTPFYPIMKWSDWLKRLNDKMDTEIAYEIRLFVKPRKTGDPFKVENWPALEVTGPPEPITIVLDENKAFATYLHLDKSFLSKHSAALRNHNPISHIFMSPRAEEARLFKIVLKYMYYMIMPTADEINGKLLLYASALEMHEFVQNLKEIKRFENAYLLKSQFQEFSRKKIRNIQNFLKYLSEPNAEDLFTLMALSEFMPSDKYTNIHGFHSSGVDSSSSFGPRPPPPDSKRNIKRLCPAGSMSFDLHSSSKQSSPPRSSSGHSHSPAQSGMSLANFSTPTDSPDHVYKLPSVGTSDTYDSRSSTLSDLSGFRAHAPELSSGSSDIMGLPRRVSQSSPSSRGTATPTGLLDIPSDAEMEVELEQQPQPGTPEPDIPADAPALNLQPNEPEMDADAEMN